MKKNNFISQGLSSREREVFQNLLEGRTNKEIAAKLFVSVNTVRTHNRNIYSKLGLKNRLELITRYK
jgi:DNA-binding NarL/FixJ family response regulator